MYCQKCGREIKENSGFCPECGNPLNSNSQEYVNMSNSNMQNNAGDQPDTLANILGCCFPIVGLVLYLVWRDNKPRKANAICKWTIGGFIIGLAVYIISLLAGVVAYL